MAGACLARPRGLVLTRPLVSKARPMTNVLVVLSQILKIFKLTTPRVGLARPRVGCQSSFLLHNIQPRTRPVFGRHGPVPGLLILLFLWFGCELGLGKWHQFFLLCIYVGFLLSFCSFCTFKLF
ncbi:hypothetical protein Hanom_Chr16g01515811 [Helianthus anomalus]